MKRLEDWKKKIAKLAAAVLCHRGHYGQLCGCHGFAAWATGKPEVYVPMAAVYLLLAVLPDRH
ncbi:MAG: hypothetical protein AAFQ19_01415 [Pseudomonadota bacterium]